MPQASSQTTKACRSGVKVAKARTAGSSRSGGTAATIVSLPISKPAAFGWTQASSSNRHRFVRARVAAMTHLLYNRAEVRRQPNHEENQLGDRGHWRSLANATSTEGVRDRGPCCSVGSKA